MPSYVQKAPHIQPPIYNCACHHMYRKLHTFNHLFTTVHAIICTESSTHSTTYSQLCMPSYIQKVSHIQLPIYIFNHLFSTVHAIICTESFTHSTTYLHIQPPIYNCACHHMYRKVHTFNHLFTTVYVVCTVSSKHSTINLQLHMPSKASFEHKTTAESIICMRQTYLHSNTDKSTEKNCSIFFFF